MRQRPDFNDMIGIFQLDPVGGERDVFTGLSPNPSHFRIFGGQMVAQSLKAAVLTVDDPKACPPHSLHSHFIRSGDPEIPVRFEVTRVRDSRTFATRHVTALQNEKIIFTMTVSFNVPEEGGFAHGDPLPDVPLPHEITKPTVEDLEKRFGEMPPEMRDRWERPEAHEGRFVTDRFMFAPSPGDPDLQIWWRSTSNPSLSPATQDPIVHMLDLAFCSDMMYMDTAMIPHGISLMSPDVLSVSICHSVWFHEAVDMHQWHLFSGHSAWAAHGRGHIDGHIYREDGLRVATTAQECLIRKAT